MLNRWLLISGSIGAHLALVGVLFAEGVWDLERLPSDLRAPSALAVMMPPAASSGAPLVPTHVDVVKRVVHETVQPVKVVAKVATATVETPSIVPGDGSGSGSGSGSGDDPNGSGACVGPACGGIGSAVAPPQPPPQSAPPPQPKFVAPTILSALRISGDTQIAPPARAANQMERDGATKVIGAFRLCLDKSGAFSSVTMVKSTGYPDYDQRLSDGIHSWVYRPYIADGQAIAACSNVTFVYAMR